MESVYKTMRSVGIGNIVIGVVVIVVGLAVGVLSIINGGRLLAKKGDIVF